MTDANEAPPGAASDATDGVSGPASGGRRAAEARTCANCAARIDTGEWHPLVTRRTVDGDLRIRAFCDGDCRDAWLES